MINALIEQIQPNKIVRYSLKRDTAELTYGEVVELWLSDPSFREYFTQLLSESPFAAFRWETPMLTSENLQQPFEFVLLNSPEFAHRKTDHEAYGEYFTADDSDFGVVSFANLSGDAMLVAPSPRADYSAYGHLAAFVRHAPKAQSEALWRIVGNTVKSRIGHKPLWLSTAGGGVAWLHVRLDSRPKYYGYAAYRRG